MITRRLKLDQNLIQFLPKNSKNRFASFRMPSSCKTFSSSTENFQIKNASDKQQVKILVKIRRDRDSKTSDRPQVRQVREHLPLSNERSEYRLLLSERENGGGIRSIGCAFRLPICDWVRPLYRNRLESRGKRKLSLCCWSGGAESLFGGLGSVWVAIWIAVQFEVGFVGFRRFSV